MRAIRPIPAASQSLRDVTDPTKDTGELNLPDVASGVLLNALPLGSNMYLYKEASDLEECALSGMSRDSTLARRRGLPRQAS